MGIFGGTRGQGERRRTDAELLAAHVAGDRYAFEELGLHRLQIAIIPRNGASRRVVEKLALREEGVALRYLEINGVWEDHVRYALTSEEWDARRTELTTRWID